MADMLGIGIVWVNCWFRKRGIKDNITPKSQSTPFPSGKLNERLGDIYIPSLLCKLTLM